MVVKSGITILVKGVVDPNDKRVIKSKRTTATLPVSYTHLTLPTKRIV